MPPAAISTASLHSMPAVDPSRKVSSPACRPAPVDCTTVSSMMPTPKNTESTAPMAASTVRRVLEVSRLTQTRPIQAEIADPASRPGRNLPSPPNAAMAMKARATPGRVAWLMASLTSERLPR